MTAPYGLTETPGQPFTAGSVPGGSINLVAQAAAIASTIFYQVPPIQNPVGPVPAGQYTGNLIYVFDWYAVITQAATTSCVLGGAGGIQLTWTDNDTGAATNPAAVPLITSAVNVVGTSICGSVVINPKPGTSVSFQCGYTSVGATPMQYSFRARLEFIG